MLTPCSFCRVCRGSHQQFSSEDSLSVPEPVPTGPYSDQCPFRCAVNSVLLKDIYLNILVINAVTLVELNTNLLLFCDCISECEKDKNSMQSVFRKQQRKSRKKDRQKKKLEVGILLCNVTDVSAVGLLV